MSAISDKSIYKSAIDKWSEEIQIDIAVEECAELIRAIQKFKRHGPSAELIHNLIEEIADVSIMIEQLTIIFGIDHVEAWKKIKLERLEKRIKE